MLEVRAKLHLATHLHPEASPLHLLWKGRTQQDMARISTKADFHNSFILFFIQNLIQPFKKYLTAPRCHILGLNPEMPPLFIFRIY